jgi:hypothetical protein
MKHRPILAAGLLMALAAIAHAQTIEDLLDTDRWADRKYGISFRPPLNAKLIGQTADDALVRVLDSQNRYQITISVKQSRSNLSLEQVVKTAKYQVLDGHPSTRVLEEKALKVGEQSAQRLYFAVPQPSTADALLGQTIVLLNARMFVVVELNCAAKHAEQARPIYEAVVETIRIADQEELARQRREAIERTRKWRATVDQQALTRAARGRPQLFRIVQAGKQDIGWMRLSRGSGEFAGLRGVQVLIEMHLEVEGVTLDSKADYFRPFETPEGEAWSVRTSIRRPGPAGQEPRVAVETGSATMGTIEIKLGGTGDLPQKDMAFPRPPHGYLPQADGWLLPYLLPHDTAGEFGFYWFNTTDDEMTFRVDKVTPTLTGFTIVSRLSPNSAELRATYDRDGNLLEKDLGGGRKLIKTDAARLRAIWQRR